MPLQGVQPCMNLPSDEGDAVFPGAGPDARPRDAGLTIAIGTVLQNGNVQCVAEHHRHAAARGRGAKDTPATHQPTGVAGAVARVRREVMQAMDDACSVGAARLGLRQGLSGQAAAERASGVFQIQHLHDKPPCALTIR
ncbi:MAG: hypothetical protein CL812_12565 [Confluentimicrobium sp.]|nr:hypothetical protein [Actibacterium sp.]